MRSHRGWHVFWALLWGYLRWDRRAAQHIDAWLILGLDDTSLHVMYPNHDRVGCRLVADDGYDQWLEHAGVRR